MSDHDDGPWTRFYRRGEGATTPAPPTPTFAEAIAGKLYGTTTPTRPAATAPRQPPREPYELLYHPRTAFQTSFQQARPGLFAAGIPLKEIERTEAAIVKGSQVRGLRTDTAIKLWDAWVGQVIREAQDPARAVETVAASQAWARERRQQLSAAGDLEQAERTLARVDALLKADPELANLLGPLRWREDVFELLDDHARSHPELVPSVAAATQADGDEDPDDDGDEPDPDEDEA
jgi:hypothetical protein